MRFSPAIGTAFQRRIEAELRRRGVPLAAGQPAEHTPSVQSLVATGEGVALMPAYVADGPRPGVAYVPIDDLPSSIPLAIAWRADAACREVHRAIDMVQADAGMGQRAGTTSETRVY